MRSRSQWVPAVMLAACMVALYAPVLRFELMGDDYQWIHHAHRAMQHPWLLLADLDTFYRPFSTWTLVLDRAVWSTWPGGYHLTNLLLHLSAGLALVLAGRRLGLGAIEGWTVGLLWTCSPFTLEPATSVAIRFEDLLLLSWLGLVLAWPRSTERWTARRIAAAAVSTLLAMLSKETWVVTPGLVFFLACGVGRQRVRKALRAALLFAGPVLLYVVVYFLAFPSDKSYFEFSLRPLAKIPHQIAAFLWFETLRPVAWEITLVALIATSLVLVLIGLGWRYRDPAMLVGAALLILPTIPTALVPYLPTRYTSIPYAGLLLLAAGAWGLLAHVLSERRRTYTIASAGVLALGVLMFAAGAYTVRADLADLKRVSDSHRALLAEARSIAPQLPLDQPIVVVREESSNPLAEIARTVRGLPKLFYVRHQDPYGLIDAAALFDWILQREDILVLRRDDAATRFEGVPGFVISHRHGRFDAAGDTDDVGRLFRRLQQKGFRVRVIQAEARGDG